MDDIHYRSIGVIRTPFAELADMPIQPPGAEGIRGTIELAAEYEAGLADLMGFSHLVLLYHFHRSKGYDLRVLPFMDEQERGLFATRAPRRPNPIGLSVVKLIGRAGSTLEIEGVDILSGTPLLDIKPYVPEFDAAVDVLRGWLQQVGQSVAERRSDDRFETTGKPNKSSQAASKETRPKEES